MNRVMMGGLEQTRHLLLQQQIGLARQLREIEKLMPKERTAEDYTIFQQKRKKDGFVYYVKYYVNGKRLPTKFSLKTNDLETAKKRAVSLKDAFLDATGKRGNRNIAFYNLLSGYYAEGSELLAESLRTKRQLSQKLIKTYHSGLPPIFRTGGLSRSVRR